MKHYFTDNQDLPSNPHQFIFNYKNKQIKFTSDNGVFSKEMVDYGSRVMLNNIEIKDNSSLLDLGCGYGAIGISLLYVQNSLQVTMADVNNRALNLCKENLSNNNLQANVINSSVYDSIDDKFDVIVTNPPIRAGKEVWLKMISEAIDHLNMQGELWVVIQKKQGAPSAKSKMLEVFGNVEIVARDKGYYILKSCKES